MHNLITATEKKVGTKMGLKEDFVAAKDLGMLTLRRMLKILENWTKSLIICSCRT